MRANGLLYAEIRAEGGLNEHGEPLGDSVQWSEAPIECAIAPVSDTRLGRYEDGEFRQASYSVIVEGERFDAGRVRLVRQGEELGEFRVASARPISLGRVLITV